MIKERTNNIPYLELRGTTKTYGYVRALDNVDFKIYPNEIIGLLGDNGAGKSTLVKIIAGVVLPDCMGVCIDGNEAKIRNSRDAMNYGIETIYQDSSVVDSMNITRNIFLGREKTNFLGKLQMGLMQKISMDLLNKEITIEGIKSPSQEVGELSGGQKQAVAIARAMYFKKRILLLDEPTNALSVRETSAFLKHLKSISKEGISIVFVTHNIYHAFQTADRFVVLSHGRKITEKVKEETSLEELTKIIVEN